MQNTLSEMWKRYNLLLSFKIEMNKLGYSAGNLYSIQVQIDLLMELIQIESMNVLNELLLKKSYLRLLKSINKGIEYLPNILFDPEGWTLDNIGNDIGAWRSKDVMLFSCKSSVNVFSRLDRNSHGKKYQDSKWQ